MAPILSNENASGTGGDPIPEPGPPDFKTIEQLLELRVSATAEAGLAAWVRL